MNKEEMVALINEMVLAYREDNTEVLEKRLRDLKYYFDDDTIVNIEDYVFEINDSHAGFDVEQFCDLYL